MAQDTQFRYGRRAPKRKTALALAPVLSGTVPPPPANVDYGQGITDWQMLGNDQYRQLSRQFEMGQRPPRRHHRFDGHPHLSDDRSGPRLLQDPEPSLLLKQTTATWTSRPPSKRWSATVALTA